MFETSIPLMDVSLRILYMVLVDGFVHSGTRQSEHNTMDKTDNAMGVMPFGAIALGG